MTEDATPWPTELKVAERGRVLKITWDDGRVFDLPAEYLRVMSPSAELRGHAPRERKVVGGKHNVVISGVDPVGSYAIRLEFDDRHTTGIYTWTYLSELGIKYNENWPQYISELEAAGLSRDKPGEKVVGDHGFAAGRV